MGSQLINNVSGGDIIISGNPWSGHIAPIGNVMLKWDKNASGLAYVGLSGGVTVNSGGVTDGVQMAPGDVYMVPRIGTGLSGTFSIFASCEQAASGKARMYYEVF